MGVPILGTALLGVALAISSIWMRKQRKILHLQEVWKMNNEIEMNAMEKEPVLTKKRLCKGSNSLVLNGGQYI